MKKNINIQDLLDASVKFETIYNIAEKIINRAEITESTNRPLKRIDYTCESLSSYDDIIGENKCIDAFTNCRNMTTGTVTNKIIQPSTPNYNICILDASQLELLYTEKTNVTYGSVKNCLVNGYIINQFDNIGVYKKINLNENLPTIYFLDNTLYDFGSDPKILLGKTDYVYADDGSSTPNGINFGKRFSINVDHKYIIVLYDTYSFIYEYDSYGNFIKKRSFNVNDTTRNYFELINQIRNVNIMIGENINDSQRYIQMYKQSATSPDYYTTHSINIIDSGVSEIYVDLDNSKYYGNNCNKSVIYPGAHYIKNQAGNYILDETSYTELKRDAYNIFIKCLNNNNDTSIYISYKEDGSNWTIKPNKYDTSYSNYCIGTFKCTDASYYIISYPGTNMQSPQPTYQMAEIRYYDNDGNFIKFVRAPLSKE